jgi:type VI secretion system secreted protein VgrG
MSLTQAGRHIRVNTDLGEDQLFLEDFEGEERVSDLFRFELTLLSSDHNFAMETMLHKPVVVSLRLYDDTDRNFHGIISHIDEVETRAEGYVVYRATMVPWTWLLTLFHDCRIFQNLSVPDIVQQVFKDRGFTDYANRLTGTYQPREYTVQYRESDFNFISRLLEDEGIFYFFEHSQDKHTLVLADQMTAFVDCPCQNTAAADTTAGLWQDVDVVLGVRRTSRLRVGKVTEDDYDFTKPKTSLIADLDSSRKGEFYEYPGKYTARDEGSRYARLRLEEQEVGMAPVYFKTNCRAFRPGFKFTLTGYFNDDANKAYAMLAVQHQAATDTHISGDIQESFTYTNRIEAIEATIPYHPPRTARRPFIQGSQTAVVVGKAGEEIWVDEYGRVKVQFFWDRAGTMDENSSCWIRVAQVWAGKGWGAIFTPRIGQEVIVDFLEGDPDRPIITGRVYNGDQTVPYTLPGEQTKSTIKSMSSKGGGGFNEIRLEDKKGSEQVFIFGQKNEDIRIKVDAKEWIGNDRHLHVIHDQLEKVGRDKHANIIRDQIEKIGRDHHVDIEGKEAIKVGGSHSETVQGAVIEAYNSTQSTNVAQTIYIKAGISIVIEAGVQISLKVGGNFVDISPAGVTIVGNPLVMINSGGAAGSGSAGSAVSPLAPTDPQEADTANPGDNSVPTAKPGTLATWNAANVSPIAGGGAAAPLASVPPPQSAASSAPTHNPNAPENQEKKHWIEVQLNDQDGNPVPGEVYKITLPDGTTIADGTLDDKGHARVDNIDPGTCQVTFPNLDKDSWEPQGGGAGGGGGQTA